MTYWVIYRAGVCTAFWSFGDIQEPRTGQTNPFVAGALVNNNTSSPVDVLLAAYTTARAWLYTLCGSVEAVYDPRGLLALWSESSFAAVAEETDGEVQCTEVVLICGTVGARGIKGKMTDLWWSQYQILNAGDTSPDNASTRNFVHFSSFMFPWTGDSTVPLTS
jgi:hypothetical protein